MKHKEVPKDKHSISPSKFLLGKLKTDDSHMIIDLR